MTESKNENDYFDFDHFDQLQNNKKCGKCLAV